jgi:hypothetical protein
MYLHLKKKALGQTFLFTRGVDTFEAKGMGALIVILLLFDLACSSRHGNNAGQEAGRAKAQGGAWSSDLRNPQNDASDLISKDASSGGGSDTEIATAFAACGPKACKSGEYCCNNSCGICAPIGGSCTREVCQPAANPCGISECGSLNGMATIPCPDGGIAGPVCERASNGQCHFVMTTCSNTDYKAACTGCALGEYCDVANCGRNGEKGVCTPSFQECANVVYEEVCGCNGITYMDACKAKDQLVAVDYKGKCQIYCPDGFADCNRSREDGCEADLSSAKTCGSCGQQCGDYPCVNGTCAVTCSEGYGNCDNNALNGCETRLDNGRNCGACNKICGDMACLDGACSNQKLNCGGSEEVVCPAEQYCDYIAGIGCGVDGAMGICKERRSNCPGQEEPVCGCDDKRYISACAAAAAGVSVKYPGECKTGVCTFGQNQTCNASLIRSDIAGKCSPDGTCICPKGYDTHTGRCL